MAWLVLVSNPKPATDFRVEQSHVYQPRTLRFPGGSPPDQRHLSPERRHENHQLVGGGRPNGVPRTTGGPSPVDTGDRGRDYWGPCTHTRLPDSDGRIAAVPV